MAIGIRTGGSSSDKTPALPKIGVRKGKLPETSGPTGEAIEQNRATQFGYGNDSPLTTGNKNYKSPGCEGGMS